MRPPLDDIAALTQALVRLPSQGGIDPATPILHFMADRLHGLGLAPALLADERGEPVALTAEVAGGRPGPAWVLDACIDTAPVTDRAVWTVDPFAGVVRDGWLYGRGAADCKVAVASFAHLAAALARDAGQLAGRLILLYDADEHTGRFGGIRRFLAERPDIAGVMVGYPENDAVNIGARGFWRARVEVHGRAQHSGSTDPAPVNAAVKLARLVERLSRAPLPAATTAEFPLPPKLTVTALGGGAGYSVVPDACWLQVDIRLTPGFGAADAAALVVAAVAAVDAELPAGRPGRIEPMDSWPAYRLAADHPLASALASGAAAAAGRPVAGQVCGPSNIGNFLARHGIPATCGFGVTCAGVHGADERIALDSLPLVWTAYATAVRRLMA